jgi:amino acid adenylation domain-containing protein
MNFNPVQGLFEQCRRTPQRLALYADGAELSYEQLVRRVARLAAALTECGIGRGERIALLASRSRIAVEALLAAAWCGAAYVPLSLRWPAERIAKVLARTTPAALIADDGGAALLRGNELKLPRTLVLPDAEAARPFAARSAHRVLSLDALPSTDIVAPAALSERDLAYIILTSGTTGEPKGVMVSCGALAAYLAALAGLKAMTPEDRASQFTELSFDPSVGEIFVPLYAGASLHVVPPVNLVSPARFIRDRGLTVWGSTPAAIAWLRDTRALKPGSLEGLRYSSFGGEPLSLSALQAWQAAAPNSIIDNLYGPTEATVDCVGQRVLPGAAPVVHPQRGILAIGTPHPGTELAVFDADRRRLARGEAGELAIAGRQLALGYLDDPPLTAQRFPVIDGKRWYFTGDLALQDEASLFHHLGRLDNQIKLLGHRVELEEVEAHLRRLAGTDQIAAVAWPVADGVAQAIVAFVAGSAAPVEQLREQLRRRLPPYMVPSAVHLLAALPRQPTGKLDRRALIERLEKEKHGDAAAG